MAFCKNCGYEIPDNSEFCPTCGTKNEDAPITQPEYYNQPNNTNDRSSFGWAFLGFILPIVGLILYIVWRKDLPLRAKSVGKGALISVIVLVVLWLICLIITGVGGCILYNVGADFH